MQNILITYLLRYWTRINSWKKSKDNSCGTVENLWKISEGFPKTKTLASYDGPIITYAAIARWYKFEQARTTAYQGSRIWWWLKQCHLHRHWHRNSYTLVWKEKPDYLHIISAFGTQQINHHTFRFFDRIFIITLDIMYTQSVIDLLSKKEEKNKNATKRH